METLILTFYIFLVVAIPSCMPQAIPGESPTVVNQAPMPREIKLTASDAAVEDWFGMSVSISDDYAIVGAMYDDGTVDYDRGAAYIFQWAGNRWVQKAKLRAEDGKAGDKLGVGVSIDGTTAIIATEVGTVYIFHHTTGGWKQQAKFAAKDVDSEGKIGPSVGISGDYAIVEASDQGAALIFRRIQDRWTLHERLTTLEDNPMDRFFGGNVSISGEYAIVSAKYDDDYGSDSGAAYIFKLSGDHWIQQTKLTPNDAGAGNSFGRSVSIDGDWAIVGAFSTSDAGLFVGAAYIFKRVEENWTQHTRLLASDGTLDDLFGETVSISGKYAIVGAKDDDEHGHQSGSAYLFEHQGETWIEKAKLVPSDGAANAWFGRSISLSGGWALVSAPWTNDRGFRSGSVYMLPVAQQGR